MTTLYNSVIPVPSSTALPVASVSIPKVLTELYNENYRLMNKEDLLRKAVEVFRSISFSDSECKAIESSTCLQRNCEEWNIQWRGCVTASSFHVYVLQDGTSPDFSCIRLLRPRDLSHITAMNWASTMKTQLASNIQKKCLLAIKTFVVSHVACGCKCSEMSWNLAVEEPLYSRCR